MDDKTKKKLEKYTGAVSVDSDVTPTLREEIKEVNAGQWGNLSTAELWEQRTTLATRLIYAQQYSTPSVAQQIQLGINQIDAVLRSKESNSDTKLL